MAAEKKMHVIYVDGLGKENSALITAVNQRGDYCPACQSNQRSERRIVGGAPCGNDSFHKSEAPLEHYVTLVYIDSHRAESDNVVKVFDVKHLSMLERETSPGLPTFHVNCWKYEEEEHAALPEDHPAFEHPFKPQEFDQDGIPLPKGPQRLAAAIADHHDTSLSMSAGTSAPVPAALSLEPSHDEEAKKLGDQVTEMLASSPLVIETKEYSDGSSATGVAPLPDQSPAQQDAQNQPNSEDLDKVEDEKKVADITSGKKNGKAKPIATGK